MKCKDKGCVRCVNSAPKKKPKRVKARKWTYKDCHVLRDGKVMLHDNYFQLEALKWLNRLEKQLAKLNNGRTK